MFTQISMLHWVDLAKRFNIHYRVRLTEHGDTDWVKPFIDKIYTLTSLNRFNRDYITSFKNVKNVAFNFNINENSNFELIDGITYTISYSGMLDSNYTDLPGYLGETIFTKNITKRLLLSSTVIRSIGNLNYIVNHNMKHASLYSVEIDDSIFCHFIEKSPNLKSLELHGIILLNGYSFTTIIEKIVKADFQHLNHLHLTYLHTQPVHFQSIIYLLNNTRASDVNIEFKIINIDSEEQVLKSEISNPHITQFTFYFLKGFQGSSSENIKDFHFLQIWKDKSKLKNITVNRDIVIYVSNHLEEMVSLHSLTISEPYRSPNLYINTIIKKNVPHLKSLYISDFFFDIIPTISNQVLLSNTHLKLLSLPHVTLDECIGLLKCQHPTITSLHCEISMNDSSILVKSIQENRTLTSLRVLCTATGMNIDFNRNDIILNVLSTNRTLENFSFVMNSRYSKISQQHLDDFNKVLSQNSVIKRINTPMDTSVEMESLHKLFNKYSIST
ncbi:hypothetical protein DLAC_04385 [Tieghemostelium lacteum]|uniref:Uncharacterized protein n=1 Tax=Tieghemostelium lacteum TaxID=361077 RepID=A0A151ZJW2_TIELA|nr:hypothetical protein DLAC_04385 [Tieghemostelium lacteum]|eukprot:KYQ94104.1 hypothetical protein DLAC_04385 [Tieghemostelium lacteum]